MEQFPAKNPNPVLSVSKDGTVLYSNGAGEPLLHEWGVEVGEKLSSNIGDIVRRVISRNIPEKTEVKAGKRVYFVAFHPLPEEECVNLYGFDITDQKELEGKLRESEEMLNFVLETSHTGAWDLDLVDRTAYRSLEHDRIFGYEQLLPQWTYEMFLDHVLPEDRALVDAKFQEATTAGKDWNFECRIRRVDDEVRWIWAAGRHRVDSNGKVSRMSGIVQDITESKQAEEVLKHSEKQYRTLGDTIPYGVWVTDAAGYCTFVSNSFLELVDMSMEQVQKFGWLHLLPPEDVQPTINHWLRCIKTGEDFEKEHRFRAKDGSYRSILAIGRPIKDKEGKITEWVGFNLDITERKQMEEYLKTAYQDLEEKVRERTIELERAYNSLKESERSLAEAQKMAHLGNWDWNLVTGEVCWSDELYSIFRRSPHESGATYDEFLNYVHPDDRDYVNNTLKKGLNGESIAGDYRIILANGEERIVHSQIRVTFDETNSPVRLRGIVQDITERKKAEETLANIEIIRKKEIHHRIKNNLQVISSLLDLQAEKFNNRECINDSEVLEAFRESQDRVISIALIHEELHEGREDDALNFSLYLQRLLHNLFQTYRFGDIEICLDLDLEKNIFFDMDIAVPLGMIINELISNSFKYAFPNRHKGTIRIKLLSKETRDKPNNDEELAGKSTKYTLSVSDDGIGISEEIDFENSDTLGLQLVNTLVSQLDGELELKKGNGTEFTIRFSVTEKMISR